MEFCSPYFCNERIKVAIVILNWNGKGFLEKFLPGIINNCPEYARIFVADNASTDDSVSFLKEKYPQIVLIELESNTGYTGGYNQSLKLIDAEYYILLNSDIMVDTAWIEPIISLMGSNTEIAACQPKIRSYSHPEYFEYAGAAGGFIDILGYPFCRGRIFETIEMDHSQYNDTTEIFWATGACMVVRAKDFWEAGAFDNDFFAHMEEIDLCWRLKKMGKKIMYCADSTVYHVGGGTLPKSSPRKTYFNFRNNLLLLAKNIHHHGFYFILAMRALLDMVAGIKFLTAGYHQDCVAVAKAWRDAMKLLRKKRKQGKSKAKGKINCMYGGSIVLNYYVRRKTTFLQMHKGVDWQVD